MRDTVLPIMLLATSLGLALSFAEQKESRLGAMLFIGTAIVFAGLPVPAIAADLIFAGTWISVAINAGTIYLPGGLKAWMVRSLAINSGLWCSLMVHINAHLLPLLGTLSVLVFLAGHILVARRMSIVLKIVASWLIAICALEIGLMFMPLAGYQADHME